MGERIGRFGRYVKDAVQDSARQTLHDHGDDQYRRGFRIAAGITQRRTQAKIDALNEQMKGGSGLSKAERLAFVQLGELKSEIEADCDSHWRGSGVDWRPVKPVATGVVRPTGEKQP